MSGAGLRVPLVDLRASYRRIREELLPELDAALGGMQLFLGPNVQQLERDFAAFCEAPHGVGVSSGTDALWAALQALEIGSGDEVIVPSHTFFASVEAVVRAGAVPVLVDVEPDTLTLDPAALEPALSATTRAILPVHLYGHPADMEPILALAREYDLRVVEDAAQAHGARYRGRRCGGLGDAGCFSFYFTKNLGAFGEGGFVTCSDAEVDERLRLLRDHGRKSRFEHALMGANLRLDELQAVVLRLKLRQLDADNASRRRLAARYGERFAGSRVRTLATRPDCEPVHHVFPIRVAERDALRAHLRERGVETGIHYAVPAHLQPALRRHAHRVLDPKRTEAACGELLSLPMYPELADEQLDYVAEQVLAFTERGGARPA